MSGSPSLDYNKHNCNSNCGTMCVGGEVVRGGKRMWAVARLACKSWSCVRCAPKKAYRLQKAIAEWVREHELKRLLTLTLDPKKLPKGIEYDKYLKKVWAKFRVYVKRELGRNLEYIAVVDYHKSGIPHLHALINEYIPQAWIKSAWSRLGGGTIVDIRRVRDGDNLGKYLSKYFTKEAILSAPKRARRYMTSRGIKLWKKYVHTGQMELFDGEKPSKWSVMDRSIEEYYAGAGRNVVEEEMDEDGAIRFFVTPEEVKEFGP